MNETLQLNKPLHFGVYEATDEFREIEKHACVCYEDLALVAVTGPAGDPLSEQYAELFAAAPQMLADARFLANVWKDIRKYGFDHLLKFGDPDGIDFVANRVLSPASDELGE